MQKTHLPKTFQGAYALVMNAKSPKDIFGKADVGEVFRMLAMIIHPDKNPRENGRAEEAFKKLGEMKSASLSPSLSGQNPQPADVIRFSTKKYSYVVAGRKAEGMTAGIFEGTVQGKTGSAMPAIIKVPHSAKDNDLMEREARAFLIMKKKIKEIVGVKDKTIAEKFLLRIPSFLESVRIEEPGISRKKTLNVFILRPGFERGWFTLEEIRRQYPEGLPSRTATFIWNRILEGLTLAHLSGLVHSAITPNHVLIQAREHLGNIIDWTASCRTEEGDLVPYIDKDRYEGYFPDELLDPRGIPTPSTDVYMSAWCMVFLLGGDPKQKLIPKKVERPIREFLNKCLQPKRRFRPHNAEAAYKEFQQIAKGLYGPRKFVGLHMPDAN